MKSHNRYELSGGQRILRWLYVLTLIVMGFTGFGQMPIFKRYYIADIPGIVTPTDRTDQKFPVLYRTARM